MSEEICAKLLTVPKAIGIYNKFLQNSVLRFNVTVIYAPTINSCK